MPLNISLSNVDKLIDFYYENYLKTKLQRINSHFPVFATKFNYYTLHVTVEFYNAHKFYFVSNTCVMHVTFYSKC